MAATFASTGTPSFYLHPAEGIHGDLGMVTESDVVIALSNSGETGEVLHILPSLRRIGAKLIAMVGNAESSLAKNSDITLDVGVSQEACPLGLAPTSSTTAALAYGDALALALLSKRKFTASQFAVFHPGGSLGRKLLLTVEDIMHSGADNPVVNGATTVQDALFVITDKGLGAVSVVDDNEIMIGVLTDGDIRRGLSKGIDFLQRPVTELMTRAPKTITKDKLAAQALHLMESNSPKPITVLPVIDEERRVMTDGSIYLDAEQELFKSFNAKDGMGISCAIRCGLQVAIITGRCSPIIRRRARELGIVEVCENVKEKRSALAELLQKYNLSLNETAYVGDDLNDLPVLTQVGLACAPADAVEEVKQVCHFVAEKKGGCGAVRQITEFILNARGDWDKIVNSYLQEGQGDAQ